jgi:hypothetical protein
MLPADSKIVVILSKGNRIVFFTVCHFCISIVFKLNLSKSQVGPILAYDAGVLVGVSFLGWEEVLKMKNKDGSRVLLKTCNYLSEINGPGYCYCIVVIYLHSVDVTIIADPMHVL